MNKGAAMQNSAMCGYGKGQNGGKQQFAHKGKAHKGGKDISHKGGKGSTELPEVTLTRKMVCKGSSGMRLDKENVVLSVQPGSPASIAGVMPTMQLMSVDGTDVSTPWDVEDVLKTPPTAEYRRLGLRVQQRGKPMRGKVVLWRHASLPKSNGTISPEVPLFLHECVMGSKAVHARDVFCHWTGINDYYKIQSLAVDQDVTFVAKWCNDKKRVFATDVRPIEGAELRAFVAEEEAPIVREGAAIREHVNTVRNGAGRICLMHLIGTCTNDVSEMATAICEDGVHVDNPYLVKNDDRAGTLTRLVNAASLEFCQELVHSASGGEVRALKVWQLQNDSLEFRFRCTEYNMTNQHGKVPDMIYGYHGTAEDNVLSIATKGFDPSLRDKQRHGRGEYFAKNPVLSQGFTDTGGYIFLSQLLLGEQGKEYDWVNCSSFPQYIMKQNQGRVQCLPQYLIQFEDTGEDTKLYRALSKFPTEEEARDESLRRLGKHQRGATLPCKGRTVEGGMMAASTSQVWVGWLDPSLGSKEAVCEDVKKYLIGYAVKEVTMDRNGARTGAYVEFKNQLTMAQLAELNARPYGEKGYRISVSDAQPNTPHQRHMRCPKLHGLGKYCRGWNLRGNWTETCSFKHEADAFPHASAVVKYEPLDEGSAKYRELADELEGVGRVTRIQRVVNTTQEGMYEARRAFLNKQRGNVIVTELWHGTSCAVLDTVLEKSLQAPSDTKPSDECCVSGNKKLSTTLCGTDCEHCTELHKWNKCHMYGLGIYLADQARKSHRYVSPENEKHTLVRCRVNLGYPFLIDSNLKQKDGMHHITYPEDPTEFLEKNTHKWDTKGHDSYLVKGLGNKCEKGMGVVNSEYVVFHPAQVLPLYCVEYDPL